MERCTNCGSLIPCTKGKGCTCSCGFVNDFTERDKESEDIKTTEVPEMPSLLTQAKNFTKSVTKHVMNGAYNAPDQVRRSRLEICSTCDYLQNDRCRACGCFVAQKAAWASEKCPLDKWGIYKASTGKCGGCGRK